MTTCREPNGFYHAGANPHFETIVINHFKEIVICHIEKRVNFAIFDWEQRLVLGFIRDFERIIISDLPSVSPCIQEGKFTVVNPYLCDAAPCVGISTNPALNDSCTAGIFILLCND